MECRQSSFWPDFFTASFRIVSTSAAPPLPADSDVCAKDAAAGCVGEEDELAAGAEAEIEAVGEDDAAEVGADEDGEIVAADELDTCEAGAAWASPKIACLIRSKMLKVILLV